MTLARQRFSVALTEKAEHGSSKEKDEQATKAKAQNPLRAAGSEHTQVAENAHGGRSLQEVLLRELQPAETSPRRLSELRLLPGTVSYRSEKVEDGLIEQGAEGVAVPFGLFPGARFHHIPLTLGGLAGWRSLSMRSAATMRRPSA